MRHIASFINTETGKPICYMVNKFKFTLNPKEAVEVNWNGFHLAMYDILQDIYNGDDHGNMTEHEYFHIKEDYFKGIDKKDVMPKMTTKDDELVYMRKLKLQKIYDKSGI